jgi:asparagine synthase (glutamine-hydrolysing)
MRRPLFGSRARVSEARLGARVFRAKTTFEALPRVGRAYFHSVSILRGPMRRSFQQRVQGEARRLQRVEVFPHAAKAQTDDPLAQVQYLDLNTYLIGDINTKVDRASMAHSLEVREPLMDHELVEWLATLPASMKIRGQEGKYLLKKAMEPSLPPEILYRPKMGFAVPLARWFRGPLRQRVRGALLGERLAATGYFDRAYLERLVQQHETERFDHSAPLWTLLMFDAFLRSVLDQTDAAPRRLAA